MGKPRVSQVLPNHWNHVGFSPIEFSRCIIVTFSMAEFVVYGCHSYHQSSGFLRTPRDHHSYLQSTYLEKKSFPKRWQSTASLMITTIALTRTSLVAQRVKHLPAMQETWVRSPGWEDALEKDNGNPLQYSCLKNSMGRGAWWTIVHRIAKSWTWLSNFSSHCSNKVPEQALV